MFGKGKAMVIGKVAGSVWATRKDEHLTGQKLLVINLIKNGKTTDNQIVATDMTGAGTDDIVLIARGGCARFSLPFPDAPVDAAVVGIIDRVEIGREMILEEYE